MITWSRAQSVKRLDGWWSFIINLYLSKFGSHSLRGSGDISLFICHVTSCGHVIAGSRNFVGCGPSAWLTSLPSVVAISLVEVEIWYILIFNVRRRIVWLSYYKVWQWAFAGFFGIFRFTKCGRLLLQSASGITKRDRFYYKVRQILTKCDSYYKVRRKSHCCYLP